jgi:hypothetical protein
MASSGMLYRVDLVRTDVSEALSASFIRVAGIGELGSTLAVTSNRRTPRGLSGMESVIPCDVAGNPIDTAANCVAIGVT